MSGERPDTDAPSNWFFSPLKRAAYRVVVIDPPWRFEAGTKSRPQHYGRMSFGDIAAMPVRDLLLPEGGRVFLWITAPLLDRLDGLRRGWGLRYSTVVPWVKLWPREGGLFFYRDSLARGTGYEVAGNAEYLAILKAGRPQSIRGNPFPGVFVTPRREHSRKPDEVIDAITARLSGPYAEIFARQARPGWDAFGNEIDKFGRAA